MLIAGYESEFELNYIGAVEIPAQAQFVAAIAVNETAEPLAVLRSSDGAIERFSSALQAGQWVTLFRFKFAGSLTETWGGKALFMDFARVDGTPDQHMGVRLRLAWHRPITNRQVLLEAAP
jgi:hypothetical protein